MKIGMIAVTLLASGCTLATMEGFEAIAPAGQRVDMTGIPGWQDGDFRLGGAQGHVRRRAVGATREWSDDPWGEVTQAVVARTGTLRFDLSGSETDGRIEGRCRYGRVEGQQQSGGLSVSETLRPMRLACAYRVDGRDAGGMDLSGIRPLRPTPAAPRLGTVDIDGTTLTIDSRHAMTGGRQPLEAPIGYVLSDRSGRVVGAIETNGTGTRRLILPRGTAERRAAIAAMVTLGLFWDPGDTD
ncbi:MULTISPECIES: hypothetical protein [unclassified Sphingomonas]|uniref:hypothetical protein n=1 Tax=unclassified Sphingomonas TaxID=196159 RepID=UPI0006F9177A|nr:MULTISPECIES: hypothetical protein [unclassified Sphingomonas]KQM27107.1 hypothetical protein ASE58_08980 [Sphingomonas sp. Leaf9]KQM43441.1 hypothetical protein ASE57_08975 [Sphingomonas sp. Leaf11]